MKTKTILHLVLTVTLLFSFKSYAQLSITKDTIQIDEIVVTGTPVKVNRSSVPMAVSVVNRAQIEDTDESALLPVLNGKVPGLFVTERGITGFGVATGSAGQISIRGIGGNPTTGVLMLIDGHPQFMGIMGHPLPDSYVSSDVERVEVIRGPASILYGSNAMGGVINIITKKQNKEGIHGNARVSYGSYNTLKYMGALGFKKHKFNAFVSVNHDQTDGHREHSDFNITNGYTKLAYKVNEHLNVSTDFSLANFDAADPGPDTLNAVFGETIDIARGYWAFAVQNEFEKLSGSFKLFYNFGEHDITDGFHSKDHNFGLKFFESLHLFEGNNITLGVDYINYGGMAENITAMNGAGLVFADTTLNELGLYGFIQQSFWNKLTLNAGLRFQNHSIYGDEWIPSVGFAYKFDETMSWKGNISKGFRSPTLKELFMWGPQNSDLEPESILNYETGILKTFLNNKVSAELTFFAVNGDNLITSVPVNGTPKYMNSGEISNKGIEFAMNAEVLENLLLNTTYSYINMKNPVYATPEHQFYFSMHYSPDAFQLMASIQQVGNLDNDPLAVVNKESYTLLKAKAIYNLTKGLKLYVSGENLLDQTYQVNRYYTMPGTTFFAGINYSF
ncbi:TonB-dependent receptor [Maribellus comscasis]|uniref:TonB-dependent receptor n=1 Tax=Maribellus comscasis TaxID=2681766 RepID=A0A6I6JLU2_9BACT|nr:TonB-dependent receptor [Maribellus comscasis]QGY43816.1 TonB-dependent receptor [Maribellus comscasis]